MINAHDKDIIERDPAIKGLGLLLRPGKLAGQLESHLSEAAHHPPKITYLRYKPGSNCIARFEFPDRIGYVKAFGEDAPTKLAKARQRDALDATKAPGRLILDELGVMISFFPLDWELRSLARLADAGQRQQLLSRVFKTDPSWRDAELTALNYKPERRYVARLNHHDGRAATLKLFCRREFESTRRSRKKLRVTPELRVPNWIGGSKNHRAMAYEWLPGDTLDQHLAQGHTEAARRVGAAIAGLHASEQPALGKRKNKEPIEVLTALERQLSWLAPDLAGDAAEISSRLARWWVDQPAARVPVHGDFYDRQVIVNPDGIGIIDLDSARLGNPLEDLGCFLAHLERRAASQALPEDTVAKAAEELRGGYLSAAPGTDLAELGAHTAFNLFKLSPHPFRDRSPDWPEQTGWLLRRCRQLLQSSRQ